jgi:hypothetical protein
MGRIEGIPLIDDKEYAKQQLVHGPIFLTQLTDRLLDDDELILEALDYQKLTDHFNSDSCICCCKNLSENFHSDDMCEALENYDEYLKLVSPRLNKSLRQRREDYLSHSGQSGQNPRRTMEELCFDTSDMEMIIKELEKENPQTKESCPHQETLDIVRKMLQRMVGKVPHPSNWGFYDDSTIEIIISDVRYCSIMIFGPKDMRVYCTSDGDEMFTSLDDMLSCIFNYFSARKNDV